MYVMYICTEKSIVLALSGNRNTLQSFVRKRCFESSNTRYIYFVYIDIYISI